MQKYLRAFTLKYFLVQKKFIHCRVNNTFWRLLLLYIFYIVCVVHRINKSQKPTCCQLFLIEWFLLQLCCTLSSQGSISSPLLHFCWAVLNAEVLIETLTKKCDGSFKTVLVNYHENVGKEVINIRTPSSTNLTQVLKGKEPALHHNSWKHTYRRKIKLVESNAKYRHLKGDFAAGVLPVWGPLPSYDPIPPPYTLYTCIL